MVANDVTAEGAGFDVDTNIVTLIDRSGRVERLEKMSKEAVAEKIIARVADMRVVRREVATTSTRRLPRRR
jgi:phosphopantothenoylcysteine decarboxylase/phosphopantothenate--cysteine ligase